jgi:HD-GYP domain-containing protein (c-di-GMP phosphodiesterase class II)
MKTVSVGDLRIGMFVAELDRPWEGTPFLLQGLLISSEEDIAQLASLCKTVEVDPLHSVGDCFSALPEEKEAPRAAPPSASENRELSFIDVARLIRDKKAERPSFPPDVDPQTQRSNLEAEILYSAQFIDDIQGSLRQIAENLKTGQALDLASAAHHIGNAAESVSRNPDAMLWLTRLKATDSYNEDHALDVAIHLMVFAHFMELPRQEVEQLGMVGLVQDIGKTHLSPELLCKSGSLAQEEAQLLRNHVKSSLSILSRQSALEPAVLEIIARHHERIDGSGYPRRLRGDDLGLHAEMAGFVDTYCAITRKRPYAKTLSAQKAIAGLVNLRGAKFRDTLVDQFIQCVGIYPIGSLVELNTGEVAVVLRQNPARRLQPHVLILLGADHAPEPRPRNIDLSVNLAIPTGEETYRIKSALPEGAYGIDSRTFHFA